MGQISNFILFYGSICNFLKQNSHIYLNGGNNGPHPSLLSEPVIMYHRVIWISLYHNNLLKWPFFLFFFWGVLPSECFYLVVFATMVFTSWTKYTYLWVFDIIILFEVCLAKWVGVCTRDLILFYSNYLELIIWWINSNWVVKSRTKRSKSCF